jgi:hypothetical protein
VILAKDLTKKPPNGKEKQSSNILTARVGI